MLNNLFYDKKGGEKLLSIWWFLVLIIVGVGVVVAVLMYYSTDEDIKGLEAEVLYNKITDCLIENGVLVQGISNPEFNLSKTCGLNEKVISEEKLCYINIGIFDEQGKKLRENIIKGNTEFLEECKFQEPDKDGKVTQGKYLAQCFKRNLNILYKDVELKKGKIEILVASNNKGYKVSFSENE